MKICKQLERTVGVFAIMVAFGGEELRADVKPNLLFADNAVLQEQNSTL